MNVMRHERITTAEFQVIEIRANPNSQHTDPKGK